MDDHEGPSAHPRAGRPARKATDLPAGYPEEYQQMVTLRDGRSVLIRPIQPSDAPALAEAIRSADADTIRLRYLGGHPQVTPGLLNFLTNVDYTSRFVLVAVEPASRRGIAIARYEPAGQDGTADVAIAVTPAGATPAWPPNCSACSPRPPASEAYIPSQGRTSPRTTRSRP
jgi:hypothetical protein